MSDFTPVAGPEPKILIVDDRPENVSSLRQVLARDDLQILSALSGNEALGLMLEHDFALVLLDVQMPGMDGFEVAELMRRHERTRHVPVIFVTAINKDSRHITAGYDTGAVDYLFKPIDPHVIRSKVRALVDMKRAQCEREAMVAELHRANTKLQEISDLKSDYLSAASHEFRTPLTVIKEFCSLVHDEVVGPVNAEQKHCLQSALRNCDRLADLVNDLLDLDSIESGNSRLLRERADLAALVESCVTDFSSRCAAAGQELRCGGDLHGSLPHVLAAPGMVTQVLVNLVGNAHKFTPEGGRISITTGVAGGQVVVSVADTGPGIAPEDQQRVFEKFAQLNRRDGPGARGTGLGLPISRKIVELHGGRLELESQPGQGSRFTFSLPVYDDAGHLRAFVRDATHNPTGLPVRWSLILLAPPSGVVWEPAARDTDLVGLVRSSEDRVGLVVVDGREANAVLLKTDSRGARSFLRRLDKKLAAEGPSPRPAPECALIDVSRDSGVGPLADPATIAFTRLDMTITAKGIVHV